MRVPDEMVEAALEELDHALKPGPVQDAFYVRQALEVVLPMVRERLVSGDAIDAAEGPSAGGLPGRRQIGLSVAAAFDAAFPEDPLDAAKGEGRR